MGRYAQIALAAAPEVVTVHVPINLLWDFDSLTNVKKDILGQLGCMACTSGFDIRWKGAAGDDLIGAALGLDLAGLDHVRSGEPQTVALAVDPRALIAAVRARRDPADPPTGRYFATVG
jgi:hypothetical protein